MVALAVRAAVVVLLGLGLLGVLEALMAAVEAAALKVPVALKALRQSELFGPARLVASHQLIPEICNA
jgi:hypothetical protein